jgi:hypothetical protein
MLLMLNMYMYSYSLTLTLTLTLTHARVYVYVYLICVWCPEHGRRPREVAPVCVDVDAPAAGLVQGTELAERGVAHRCSVEERVERRERELFPHTYFGLR